MSSKQLIIITRIELYTPFKGKDFGGHSSMPRCTGWVQDKYQTRQTHPALRNEIAPCGAHTATVKALQFENTTHFKILIGNDTPNENLDACRQSFLK